MLNTSIFREQLLEIYSDRPNFGKLKNKTHEVSVKNPVCDDVVNLELEIKDGRVVDAKFTGSGCFVTTVSTSVLLDKVKGMKIEEVMKLEKKNLDEFLGVEITSTRTKCQLLSLEALKKCLK